MFRKTSIIICICLALTSITAFAATPIRTYDHLPVYLENEVKVAEAVKVWGVEKSIESYEYGDWRDGPSGHGPGTLALNKTNQESYSISFTNTISGDFHSKSRIEASLGITIGKSKSHGTSWTIDVGEGEWKRIIFRPYCAKYKVVETQYWKQYFPGSGWISWPTGTTKTSYVISFVDWDYSSEDVE